MSNSATLKKAVEEENPKCSLASPQNSANMSSSLKDRLKRCGRYHSSTPPTKKRCIDSDNRFTPKDKTPSQVKMETSSEIKDVHSPVFCENTAPHLLTVVSPVPNSTKLENHGTPIIATKSKILKCRKLELERNNFDKETCCNELVTYSPGSNANDDANNDHGMLVKEKERLQNDAKEKEETLRKLKMVKMYRKKNDLSTLEELISKWRQVSQEAILDLHNMLPEPKPSLTELIQHLQLDKHLIRYNSDDESFD